MTDEIKNANEFARDAEVHPEVADQTGQVYVADPTSATTPPGGAPQASSDGSAGGSNAPIWVLVVVVALFLACLCAMMLAGVGAVGILSSQQSDQPIVIVPPIQEQPAEQPPQEQPTEAPPEPEAPAEEPEKEPPAADQPPSSSGEGSLPCVPLAGGLVLAPLLAIGKRNGIGRRLSR